MIVFGQDVIQDLRKAVEHVLRKPEGKVLVWKDILKSHLHVTAGITRLFTCPAMKAQTLCVLLTTLTFDQVAVCMGSRLQPLGCPL